VKVIAPPFAFTLHRRPGRRVRGFICAPRAPTSALMFALILLILAVALVIFGVAGRLE
jgi:hypothetical protein